MTQKYDAPKIETFNLSNRTTFNELFEFFKEKPLSISVLGAASKHVKEHLGSIIMNLELEIDSYSAQLAFKQDAQDYRIKRGIRKQQLHKRYVERGLDKKTNVDFSLLLEPVIQSNRAEFYAKEIKNGLLEKALAKWQLKHVNDVKLGCSKYSSNNRLFLVACVPHESASLGRKVLRSQNFIELDSEGYNNGITTVLKCSYF